MNKLTTNILFYVIYGVMTLLKNLTIILEFVAIILTPYNSRMSQHANFYKLYAILKWVPVHLYPCFVV